MVEESLVVRDLHAWYGGGHALQGVSLNLKLGTMAAVIGRNGAGKSTFLKAIMGLIDKCQGSVTLGGNQVQHLPPSQRAKLGLAYIAKRTDKDINVSIENEKEHFRQKINIIDDIKKDSYKKKEIRAKC